MLETEVKKLGVPAKTKVVLIYLDGRKVNGEEILLEDILFDQRVCKTIRLRNITREGQLANYVGMQMRDARFQASLTRLESFGLITRKTRKWGFGGDWIELADEDKKVDVTNRGLMAEQSWKEGQ
jgi:hypothetical protein